MEWMPPRSLVYTGGNGLARRLSYSATADSPLVPSLPGHVITLPGHFSAGKPSRVCSLVVSTVQVTQNQA